MNASRLIDDLATFCGKARLKVKVQCNQSDSILHFSLCLHSPKIQQSQEALQMVNRKRFMFKFTKVPKQFVWLCPDEDIVTVCVCSCEFCLNNSSLHGNTRSFVFSQVSSCSGETIWFCRWVSVCHTLLPLSGALWMSKWDLVNTQQTEPVSSNTLFSCTFVGI